MRGGCVGTDGQFPDQGLKDGEWSADFDRERALRFGFALSLKHRLARRLHPRSLPPVGRDDSPVDAERSVAHTAHMPRPPAPRSPALPIRLAISWLTNALVLGIVAAVFSGVTVKNAGALLEAAAVFGVLNTLLKPLLRLVTVPLAILTFGVAWFFVSLLMLVLTKAIVSGFHVHGFWALVEATLIVWVVNLLLDFVPGPWQVTGKRRRRRRLER